MILTLTAASGAGKTTIAKKLLENLPVYTRIIPSYTIRKFRKPRPTDIPGEYKYVSRLWFWLLKTAGAFLWTVYPHGNSYGTTKRSVIRALKDDNTIYIMILTPEAVIKLKNFSEKRGYFNRIFSFYILAPLPEVLKERLRARGDQENEIEKRLGDCMRWDSEAKRAEISYEFVENNGTIESATEEVVARFLKRFGGCDCYF